MAMSSTKENPYLVWRSTERSMRPCDCEACIYVYGSRGVVSPHRASSCPWRRPRDLQWIRDPDKKRTEPFTIIVGEIVPFGRGEEMHGDWLHATYSTAGPSCWLGIDDLITRARTSPFFEMMRDKMWRGTDQRDAIKKGIGGMVSRIEATMAEREFSEEAERVLGKILGAYALTPADLGVTTNSPKHKENPAMYVDPTCTLCNPKSPGEQRMSSSISARSLADQVRELGRDHSNDLGSISDAIKRAEADRKQIVVDALRSLVRLEKAKNCREGREFALAYQYDGEEYIAHGVDFAYGEVIDEDDVTNEMRVFLSEAEGLSYEHYTMQRFKKYLEDSDTPYVIDYLD